MAIGSAVGTAAIVRVVLGSACVSWETAPSGTTGSSPTAQRAKDGARNRAIRISWIVRRIMNKRADISARQPPCQGNRRSISLRRGCSSSPRRPVSSFRARGKQECHQAAPEAWPGWLGSFSCGSRPASSRSRLRSTRCAIIFALKTAGLGHCPRPICKEILKCGYRFLSARALETMSLTSRIKEREVHQYVYLRR